MDGKLLKGVTFAASHQLRAPHGCCQAFKEHFVPQIFLLLVTDSNGLASPHFPYNISECCFWESQRPSRSLSALYRPGPGVGVGLFLSSYCNVPSILPSSPSLPPFLPLSSVLPFLPSFPFHPSFLFSVVCWGRDGQLEASTAMLFVINGERKSKLLKKPHKRDTQATPLIMELRETTRLCRPNQVRYYRNKSRPEDFYSVCGFADPHAHTFHSSPVASFFMGSGSAVGQRGRQLRDPSELK